MFEGSVVAPSAMIGEFETREEEREGKEGGTRRGDEKAS